MTPHYKILPHRLFRSCASGAVAVEFVFVFPLLMGLLFAGNEVARFLRTRQQLTDYATMVAYDVAGVSADVNPEMLREMIQRIGLVAPEVIDPTQSAWSNSSAQYFRVGISLVQMTPKNCPTNSVRTLDGCSFDAQVKWSYGNLKRQACALLTARGSVGNLATTLTTLPSGAFQPNAVVVVNVWTTYRPMFPHGFELSATKSIHVDLGLAVPLMAETWQPLRNWRGGATGASFPVLTGLTAGYWNAYTC
jgi:hypothetical protein